MVYKWRYAIDEVVNEPASAFQAVSRYPSLRGAVAAGAPSPSVEFHLPDGGKMVVNAGGKLEAASKPRKPLSPRNPRLAR
jgi:hypothetical protein